MTFSFKTQLLLIGLLFSTYIMAQTEDLVTRLSGRFDNLAQVTTLPDSISQKPALSGAWLNPLHLTHQRIDLPWLDGAVLYLEWREGHAEGALNRQRFWVFHTDTTGRTTMDFYSFKDEQKFLNFLSDNTLQVTLTLNDLVAYPNGCTLSWHYAEGVYTGQLDPQTCSVVAQRSGRRMRLQADIIVSAEGFTYQEAGVVEADGSYAFKVPGLGAYIFRKK